MGTSPICRIIKFVFSVKIVFTETRKANMKTEKSCHFSLHPSNQPNEEFIALIRIKLLKLVLSIFQISVF